MFSVLKAGILYYVCVFGAGFAFGVMRVFIVLPLIGERYAELAEMPFMLAVIYYSARFILRRFPDATEESYRSFAIGSIAFVLLLFSEYFVVWMQGKEFYEYLMTRDPVSFGAYLLSLLVYWLMPWILVKRRRAT